MSLENLSKMKPEPPLIPYSCLASTIHNPSCHAYCGAPIHAVKTTYDYGRVTKRDKQKMTLREFKAKHFKEPETQAEYLKRKIKLQSYTNQYKRKKGMTWTSCKETKGNFGSPEEKIVEPLNDNLFTTSLR